VGWQEAASFSVPSVPAALHTASWTLEELSKVVKMPVGLLRRRVSVWLQQGVLREEPPGTFSVIEEERPQDCDNMVLIDSDDESDSGMASQADQKEEELLVRKEAVVDWGQSQWAA
jgi:anaphase-promoting complex subunit 2